MTWQGVYSHNPPQPTAAPSDSTFTPADCLTQLVDSWPRTSCSTLPCPGLKGEVPQADEAQHAEDSAQWPFGGTLEEVKL